MDQPVYLTQQEAADLCGCHYDTIRRARRDGRLPNHRVSSGTIEVRVTDLVEAGLLDPRRAAGDPTETVGRTRLERDLTDTRTALAVRTAERDSLRDQLRQARDEIDCLRSLLKKAVA